MRKLFTLTAIAFIIFQNSYAQVGIGTPTPDAGTILHVHAADLTKGLLATGTYNFRGTVPDYGAGTRLMFYPGKSAFRAGTVMGTEWDNANVGIHSTATGFNTIASGNSSVAMGSASTARDYAAIALGYSCEARNEYSTAIGNYNIASADYSTALGIFAHTSGRTGSFAIGDASTLPASPNSYLFSSANNQMSMRFAGGYRLFSDGATTETNMLSFVNGNLGLGTSAPISKLHVKGSGKFFTGGNNYTGNFYNGTSSLDGIELVSVSANNAYIGVQSTTTSGLHISKSSITNNNGLAAFFVNGTNVGSITTNGTTTSYNTTSDYRLKENLTASRYGLNALMKINVEDYNYVFDSKKALQTGFMAQQLYAVYPQAVQVGGDDAKTNPWMVDYSKMSPLLVKSIQEQQQVIEEQNKKISSLEERLKKLEAQILK